MIAWDSIIQFKKIYIAPSIGIHIIIVSATTQNMNTNNSIIKKVFVCGMYLATIAEASEKWLCWENEHVGIIYIAPSLRIPIIIILSMRIQNRNTNNVNIKKMLEDKMYSLTIAKAREKWLCWGNQHVGIIYSAPSLRIRIILLSMTIQNMNTNNSNTKKMLAGKMCLPTIEEASEKWLCGEN